MVPAFALGAGRRRAGQAARRRLRAERRRDEELDAGRRRARFELTPTLEPLAPLPGSHARADRPEQQAAGRPDRRQHRRPRARVHAVPDRRAAEAHQQRRDPRRRLDGPDVREAGGRAHAARLARARARGARLRRLLRRRLQLRLLRTRSPGAAPTTPLPMENNPRVVFERLFGDGGSTDPARGSRASRRTAACSTR